MVKYRLEKFNQNVQCLTAFLCVTLSILYACMVLQYKHNIHPLLGNIKSICTRIETGMKCLQSMLFPLFLKLVQFFFMFADNVCIMSIYTLLLSS